MKTPNEEFQDKRKDIRDAIQSCVDWCEGNLLGRFVVWTEPDDEARVLAERRGQVEGVTPIGMVAVRDMMGNLYTIPFSKIKEVRETLK